MHGPLPNHSECASSDEHIRRREVLHRSLAEGQGQPATVLATLTNHAAAICRWRYALFEDVQSASGLIRSSRLKVTGDALPSLLADTWGGRARTGMR